MIKARMERTSGVPLVVLGITPDNIRELKNGRPIYVNGTEVGIPSDLAVMFGPTNEAIADEIRQAAGGMKPESIYTCCPAHAAQSGVPHNPLPGMTCPDDPGSLFTS